MSRVVPQGHTVCHVGQGCDMIHLIHDCDGDCVEYDHSPCTCPGNRPVSCAGGWIRHGG